MISYFVRHPTAANLMMLLLLAIGVFSLGRLRRETFPDALPTEVDVTVLYPGASPLQVDADVVDRLEDALEGVQHLQEMRSESQSGRGVTTLRMKTGGDYATFRNEIENAVESITDLPSEAESPIIRRLHASDQVLDVLVEGDLSDQELKSYCDSLRRRLLAEDAISEATVAGFSKQVIRAELRREATLRHGLSPTAVVAAIQAQSLGLPAGMIEGATNVPIRLREEKTTPAALEKLVVAGVPGRAEVRLRDVGTVTSDFQREEERITVRRRRAAVVKIQKAKSEDSLSVAAAAKELLRAERATRPDLRLTVINDVSRLVGERIGLLARNGIQGCLLVFFVMWLFFNARLSFWVVLSLPVSFLAAFALVPSLGLTINMLTMVGLLMAIGLLMDDGIVIAENVARRGEEGEPADVAAIAGVREVAGGVVSSFLTTCCVLGPLIFLDGEIGRVLRVLPMMLLLVLGTSLIEAFLILPAHLSHSLGGARNRTGLRARVESGISACRRLTARLVSWTIRWRYAVAGLTAMSFFLTIAMLVGGIVRGQVFPKVEGETLVARVLMQPGTPLGRTSEVVRQLEAALERTSRLLPQPGGKRLVETTYAHFSVNQDAKESGPHVATLTVELLANEQRQSSISQVISAWREEVGEVRGAQSVSFDEPQLGPGGRPIELELSGLSLDELDPISSDIQRELRTFVGVYNVSDDTRRGQREIHVELQPGAVGLGLSARELGRQLRGSFQGLLGDQVQVEGEVYDVEVRFAKQDRISLTDLEEFRIVLEGGDTIPLSEVATLKRTRGWSRVGRRDGRAVINVLGNVDSGTTNTIQVLHELRQTCLDRLEAKHPGLRISIRGEAERGAETGLSIGKALLFGLLGVFVILSFQFRSYREPLVVMVAIPFAFVGVVWGHYLFGMPISLPSVMGYASLTGIVVNDSILLVLFLKSHAAGGVPVEEAARMASEVRFRAVTITSLTTIVGLLPLLLERSLQAQVLIPIAISICFGLLSSTVLILLVLPALYVILSDLGWTER